MGIKISMPIILLTWIMVSHHGLAGESNLQLSTSSGFTTEALVDVPDANVKNIGIVLLHGKQGNPDVHHNSELRTQLVKRGFATISPVMPWSAKKYQGARQQGQEIITEAVKALNKDKVVIIGHSMGAMAALQYGTGDMPSQVVGIVSVAPGHDPNIAKALEKYTSGSASKACSMESTGAGKEFDSFNDMDGPERRTIRATAEYYCDHYSTNKYPDTRDVVRKVSRPVLLISGTSDRLTEVYSHNSLFNGLPDNAKNKYAALDGGHIEVLYRHPDVIAQWIDSL